MHKIKTSCVLRSGVAGAVSIVSEDIAKTATPAIAPARPVPPIPPAPPAPVRTPMDSQEPEGIVIYPIELGHGAYGTVKLAYNKKTNKFIAVKVELKKSSQLTKEYQLLNSTYTGSNVIRALSFWKGNAGNCMALDLVGPSIKNLHKACENFSLKTTVLLAIQMVSCLRHYHDRGIIHRDVKPDNFAVEFSIPHRLVYLIDFGLSKKFRTSDGQHIPFSTSAQLAGSLRYMSKYTHEYIEMSRRDDMYSLGYVIVYLMVGKLPWHNITVNVDEKYKHRVMCKAKKDTSNATLTRGLGCNSCKITKRQCNLPSIMEKYFDYLDTVKFEQDIDYDTIIHNLRCCLAYHNIPEIPDWDWNKFYGMTLGSSTSA